MSDQVSIFKRRLLLMYTCVGSAVSIAVWGMFVLENHFGISINGHKLARDKLPMSIWIPGAATAIVAIGSVVMYRRSIGFMTRAVRVFGTLDSIGSHEMYGMRDAAYSYEYEGASFQIKRSISTDAFDDLKVGNQVAILVDRSNPGSSRLASEFAWAITTDGDDRTGTNDPR